MTEYLYLRPFLSNLMKAPIIPSAESEPVAILSARSKQIFGIPDVISVLALSVSSGAPPKIPHDTAVFSLAQASHSALHCRSFSSASRASTSLLGTVPLLPSVFSFQAALQDVLEQLMLSFSCRAYSYIES